jgi:hypothetical protein
VSAELAARRTAAAAILADFRAEVARSPLSQPPAGSWALRLAIAVDQLLEASDGQAAQAAMPAALLLLSESNEAVLGQALADAIAHRTPQGICPECDEHPAGLCEDHADDLDRTDAYLALARELGIEVEQ